MERPIQQTERQQMERQQTQPQPMEQPQIKPQLTKQPIQLQEQPMELLSRVIK